MSNIFEFARVAKPKKAAFDLSHERKFSAKMGKLTPVLVEEVVPGEKWSINSELFIRIPPLIAPVMHRFDAFIHYFFVPNRILWEDWEKFITGDLNTVVPHVDINGETIVESKLADHMGIPPNEYHGVHEDINMLPFRAYYQIYNDYYRDEDLQTEIDYLALEAGPNPLQADLLDRCWQKDYFTSARPWIQKGNPVSVHVDATIWNPSRVVHSDGTNVGNDTLKTVDDVGDTPGKLQTTSDSKDAIIQTYSALNVDISELRVARLVQRFLETKARAGSRYIEFLRSVFGRYPNDARLQRAEYIGGGRTPVVISEVLNTNGRDQDLDAAALPQGNMSGHALAVGNQNKAFKNVEEHGWIIGIMSVIPRSGYFQGLHKKFSRSIYTDYLIPEFAMLSEQAVKGKEVYFSHDDPNNNAADWGYQVRFGEYKFGYSSVHGEFRSTMDHYHACRKFDAAPTLNADFVKCVPTERIFAVQDSKDNLWCQVYHNIKAIRPLPFVDVTLT